jgi:SNF2 family DNA or RNA helicase
VASIGALFSNRKTVLQMLQAANTVYEDSANLQRATQNRAYTAKTKIQLKRGEQLGSQTPDEIALLVAIDAHNHARNSLNVATNELRSILNKTKPYVHRLDSTSKFLFKMLSREKRLTVNAEILQAKSGLEIAHRLINSRLTPEILSAIRNQTPDTADVLTRFAQNTSSFFSTFEQLTDDKPTADRGASSRGRHGDIPNDIANNVEMFLLDQGPLRASLRRYQDFGARYLIVQKRTLLGDDMGLGKTVQVLAAMCHLHANGSRHFFVVAPNSVLVNWQREVEKHTELKSYLAHGADREQAIKRWAKSGGIAITSYSTLPKLIHLIKNVDFLAVDEAHYAKNPEAQRTIAIGQIGRQAKYVSLMTGTALENKVEELQNLLEIAHPGAVRAIRPMMLKNRTFDKSGVAKQLAHVYLRRTQADVLTELPERIETDEWVTLSDEDRSTYNNAPINIMLKRKSATITQAKYERLADLIDEHRQANRKIVVFSFFRQVVFDVSSIYGNCPQITGDVSSAERQAIIDTFTNTPGFAVLASQIDAGGVGINLQAASVVILMEAQFKPSTEWQAIARVHRMGQSRTVNVHRILASGTIEEHLVRLIKQKANLFMAYAHESAIKDSSAMASDPNKSSIEDELLELLAIEAKK